MRPWAVMPSRPVMSPAARSAFRMASSAAAWKSGVMYSLETMFRGNVTGGLWSPARTRLQLPREKVRSISSSESSKSKTSRFSLRCSSLVALGMGQTLSCCISQRRAA